MDRDGLIRAFVAAELPESVREELGDLAARLRARGVRARWVLPDRMHITVRFLGEIPPERFEAVREALAPPLPVAGPIRLTPAGLGAFPPRGRARVLWVGLEGDTAALGRCALEVETRLEDLGFLRETRPFRPHITLGRARGPGGIPGLERLGPAERSYRGTAFEVAHLTLFESRLGPGGPDYIERGRAPLGPAQDAPPR